MSLSADVWEGCLPVELCLSPSALSTASRPRPVFLHLSRLACLPLAALEALRALSKHVAMGAVSVSPATVEDAATVETGGDNRNSAVADVGGNGDLATVVWFEEAQGGQVLRCQYPLGVLYDMHAGTATADEDRPLPWRILVHFGTVGGARAVAAAAGAAGGEAGSGSAEQCAIPMSEIATTAERWFWHAFKQTLHLQYGSTRLFQELPAEETTQLWKAVQASNFNMYCTITAELGQHCQLETGDNGPAPAAIRAVPVRIARPRRPVVQPLVEPFDAQDGHKVTVQECLEGVLPALFVPATSATTRATEAEGEEKHGTSLADGGESDDEGSSAPGGAEDQEQPVRTLRSDYAIRVHGVDCPLDAPLVDLWRGMHNPDSFLYLAVARKSA